MSIKIGDTVQVVDCNSLPQQFIGKKGKVIADLGYKVVVEFIPRQGNIGSLSHTAYVSDLEKVEVNL